MRPQFGAMLARPFKGFRRVKRIRVSSLNNQCLYNDRDPFIFARNHTKMRRRVIIKIHLNATAVEPDDRGHE
jgi:hypothetical protein